MNKRIVLCADDYGQGFEISQGIINLIKAGSLSATSCLVNESHWWEHANWLLPYHGKIDIGLHFNLTEGKALSAQFIHLYGSRFPSLFQLMKKAFFSRLNLAAIEAECHAQLDAFEKALGFLPHFIDGHQHVHQFPVIRTALINVYKKRLNKVKSYIRLVKFKLKPLDLIKDTKKWVIFAAGAPAFEKLLKKESIPHNSSFAGMYAFKKANQYKNLFANFLAEINDGGLIMCHPGLNSLNGDDAIKEARYFEYQFLSNQDFKALCAEHQTFIQTLGSAHLCVVPVPK